MNEDKIPYTAGIEALLFTTKSPSKENQACREAGERQKCRPAYINNL
jgi:hypothetical protein